MNFTERKLGLEGISLKENYSLGPEGIPLKEK